MNSAVLGSIGARAHSAASALSPYLIGLYFAVFLWAENLEEGFGFRDVIAVLGVAFSGIFIGYLILRVIARGHGVATLILLIWSLFFFSFGRIYIYLASADVIASQRPLIATEGIILAIATLWILRKSISGSVIVPYIGFVLIFLISINVMKIAVVSPEAPKFQPDSAEAFHPNQELIDQVKGLEFQESNLPDIYFFIFDMYASRKSLKKYHDIDISNFVGSLENLGFVEIADSRTTYTMTRFSVSSTMNMAEISDIDGLGTPMTRAYMRTLNVRVFPTVLSRTNAGRVFKELGYKTYATTTSATARPDDPLSSIFLTKYAEYFLNTVALRVIQSKIVTIWHTGFGRHNISANLEREIVMKLSDDPQLQWFYSEPPHESFVFEPNGDLRGGPVATSDVEFDIELYRKGYSDSIEFVNRLFLKLVTEILANSEDQPIIIVQGDHGPNDHVPEDRTVGFDYKTRILNLMYLPDRCDQRPPNDLTSVNTFRFILNSCFSADVEYLTNRSFYGTNRNRFLGIYLHSDYQTESTTD